MIVTMRSSSSEVSSPALYETGVSVYGPKEGTDCLLMKSDAVPLVEVDVGLLADQVGVAAADTLDLGQGVHDLLFAIDLKNILSAYLSSSRSCI